MVGNAGKLLPGGNCGNEVSVLEKCIFFSSGQKKDFCKAKPLGRTGKTLSQDKKWNANYCEIVLDRESRTRNKYYFFFSSIFGGGTTYHKQALH